MQYLDANLKNDRMIFVCFEGKPFKIRVMQVYTLASNAEEAEAEGLYEDLQDLLELTPKKMSCSLLEFRNSINTWSNRQICPWSTE